MEDFPKDPGALAIIFGALRNLVGFIVSAKVYALDTKVRLGSS